MFSSLQWKQHLGFVYFSSQVWRSQCSDQPVFFFKFTILLFSKKVDKWRWKWWIYILYTKYSFWRHCSALLWIVDMSSLWLSCKVLSWFMQVLEMDCIFSSFSLSNISESARWILLSVTRLFYIDWWQLLTIYTYKGGNGNNTIYKIK